MTVRLRSAEKLSVLGALPLFEDLTRKELQQVAAIAVEAERSAGTRLTHEGHAGDLMFVLIEGEADVLTAPEDGSPPQLLGRLRAGDSFGELSLIDGRARSARVAAVTDVRLLEITREDFLKLIDRSPAFVRNLLRSLSLKVRDADSLTN